VALAFALGAGDPDDVARRSKILRLPPPLLKQVEPLLPRLAWQSEVRRLIWRSLTPFSSAWLTTALVIVFLGSLAASLAPLALKDLLDNLVEEGERHPPQDALLRIVAVYIAALFVQRLCEQVQIYAYSHGEQRLIRGFAGQAYVHLLRLPLSFHVSQASGTTSQVLANGTQGLRSLLAPLVMNVVPTIAQITIAAFVLFSVVGSSIALVLVTALLSYFTAFALGIRRLDKPMREVSAAQGRTGGATNDGLMNVETIKIYTAERQFARRYDAHLGEVEDRYRVFIWHRTKNGMLIAVVFSLAIAATLLLTGQEVVAGRLSLGAFVMVNTYLVQLVRPLETLGFAARDIGQGVAYLGELEALLTAKREVLDLEPKEGAETPQAAALSFRNVSFSYNQEKTLRDINFSASPGQFIAIVGRSGAGKSSLLRLIMRLYEPSAGEIALDGRPVSEMALAELRQQVALVSQDTILLNDTIAANIALGADEATEATVTEAARRACLAELLSRLPEGLATQVGERGLKLSGGEKQRVSIARATLRRARLVLFDEATAALDPVTEAAVWEAMNDLRQGATTIIVTHRLTNVVLADEILVLDRGRISERGSHSALITLNGLYAELFRTQTSDLKQAAET
jgi:ABC-type multidrug transport system fused ATPase/permease subunit